MLCLPLGLWSQVSGDHTELQCEAGVLLDDGRLGGSLASYETGTLCSATNCLGSSQS